MTVRDKKYYMKLGVLGSVIVLVWSLAMLSWIGVRQHNQKVSHMKDASELLNVRFQRSARFTNVKAYFSTTGHMFVHGYVATEQDVLDLKELVCGSSPPAGVHFSLEVRNEATDSE